MSETKQKGVQPLRLEPDGRAPKWALDFIFLCVAAALFVAAVLWIALANWPGAAQQ